MSGIQRAVTSASNLFRRKLCPGSARQEARYGQEDSEYSAEGTLLHAAYMRPIGDVNWRPYSTEQIELVKYANTLTVEFIAQFKAHIGIPEDADSIIEYEVELMLLDEHGNPLAPGHADYVETWPEYSARCVIDAKFGWVEVDEAPENDQLAHYAIGKYQVSPVHHTGVAIAQPRNYGPRISTAIYTEDAIQTAIAGLGKIVRDSEKPDAPLIPSAKACNHCRAKVDCEAYKAPIMALEKQGLPLEKKDLPLAVKTLTSDKLAGLHRAIAFGKKIDKPVTDEIRTRAEEGRMPNWKLQNTGDDREVTDPLSFWQAFKNRFHETPNFAMRFDECREMSWGRLTALVMELTGENEKKAKALIEELGAGFVTKTPKAKRVVEEKAK